MKNPDLNGARGFALGTCALARLLPYGVATLKQHVPEPDARHSGTNVYRIDPLSPFTRLVAGLFHDGHLRGLVWFDDETFTIEKSTAEALLDLIDDLEVSWQRFSTRAHDRRKAIYGGGKGGGANG
jgi:hypothetical protein